MKDWKTTLFGALTAAGLGMTAAPDPTIAVIGKIIAAIGALFTGIFAKQTGTTQ